jgi:transcriptional regulator GlxA family with amidase domain
MHNAVLTDWIKARSREAELVLSVCTGALLLAKAGLLDGLEATTHHGAMELLRQVAPKTTVHGRSHRERSAPRPRPLRVRDPFGNRVEFVQRR